jgi:hypothetical protein
MLGFLGDVVTVMISLYLYDKFKDWRDRRRYHAMW